MDAYKIYAYSSSNKYENYLKKIMKQEFNYNISYVSSFCCFASSRFNLIRLSLVSTDA